MSPNFLPGDFVLVWRHPWQQLSEGDNVVIRHPKYGIMIKQVAGIDAEGITLRGINHASISSAAMGHVPQENILGKVLYHVKAPKQ